MRVRHHGDVARLELGPEEFGRVVGGLRDEVVRRVKAAGYTYVAVDLQGYRTGAMNEALRSSGRSPRLPPVGSGAYREHQVRHLWGASPAAR
jgi:uncharacterized protein